VFRIKEIRKKKGFTQIQLANKVDITNVYLSYLENGARKPSFDVLERIAQALGVTVNDLLEEQKAG